MPYRSSAGCRRLGLLSLVGVLFVGGLSQAQTPPPVHPSGLSILSLDAPRASAKDPQPIVEEGPRTPSNPRAQGPVVQPSFNIDPSLDAEVEPNGTPATATPLPLNAGGAHVYGNIVPNGDLDYYSFTAAAGDRVYAATQTSATAGGAADSVLELFASDGTTIIEGDEDDGSFASLSSSIAGTTIPAAGTYYLRVKHNSATVQLRPYQLYFQLRSGTPTAETEPNDTFPGQALPASSWVAGDVSSATDVDFYSVDLNAGDTIYLSLDLDPERNGDVNLQLGLGPFDTQILVVNDSGAGFAPYTAPDSEAFFMTVKDAGTYGIYVAMPTGGSFGTYQLSARVFPRVTTGVNCTTYTSTNVPIAIPDAGAAVTSTITVPGNPRIADINVAVQGTHMFMADLDVHLISPAGNDNGLFTDVFNQTTGGRSTLDVVFDDEAAIPPSFQNSAGLRLQPEFNYRLAWFDGEDAGGTWTLSVRDDVAVDTGSITGWSIEICEAPPPPACAPGFVRQTVYSTDFESGAAGFTHSGTLDEWELGLPATAATTTANPVAAFNSCASGTNCWKTDLDNTYDASSTQDLLSPNISLGGFSPPVVVSWSQRYQMDTATNDHYHVSIQPVGTPAGAVRLFEHLDAVMTDSIGTPAGTVGASAGWGVVNKRADAFAGQSAELVFHLDSGTGTSNYGGAAIDDVTVTACRVAIADLSITKTDGVTTATPGGSVTYTIAASNAGPDAVTGATVADTFPAPLTCTWTCVGAGGGTCTASGSGDINDATVSLPAGGNVTYTASCAISALATGVLSNTATVSSTLADTNPANNSANDADTLTPQADLSITKTDGVTSVTAGGTTTYTITASNAGPSYATGVTVADTFPASLTCTWTCVGAGGGACTGAGVGNINDTLVNLLPGGSTTYTASCNVALAATGTLTNTATVTAPGGTTDPTPGNNSATDTDTINAAGANVTGTKTVTGPFTPGATIAYTVVLTNSGGPQANNPGNEFTDVLPAGLTLVSATATSGTAAANVGTNTVTWNGALPLGGSATITINATIAPSATGTISNQGIIAYDSDANGTNDATRLTDDPAAGGASDTTTFTIGGAVADLSITKTDGVTSALAGGTLTYTIVVGNAGPSSVVGATVSDAFPADCTSPTWTCVAGGGAACPASGSGNIAANVDVPVGGTATFTATCTVASTVTHGAVVTNTASVAAPAGANDPNPGDNSATDTTTVAVGAVLQAAKSVAGTTFQPGTGITYTIELSNFGGPQNDNPGDELTDVLPAGLTLVSATATSGTAVANVGTNTVTWNGAIAAGDTVTITIAATIAPTASGTIANQATFVYDGDANGTNETTGLSFDPSVKGDGPTEFDVVAIVPAVPVPALGTWALLLIALGLVALAARRGRRRFG